MIVDQHFKMLYEYRLGIIGTILTEWPHYTFPLKNHIGHFANERIVNVQVCTGGYLFSLNELCFLYSQQHKEKQRKMWWCAYSYIALKDHSKAQATKSTVDLYR